MKEVSLILETNNLRGGNAEEEKVFSSLVRLIDHLMEQTISIQDLREIIITHDGLSLEKQIKLKKTSGLDNLKFVEISKKDNYYQAKEIGFKESSSPIVIFADSDCLPVRDWLREMIMPFLNPSVSLVSGRTTYDDSILGIAATTIDFMYFGTVLNPKKAKNFYANNIAFRREVFEKYHFSVMKGQYRGQCQALGLRLLKDGIPIYFANKAKTVHRFPDSFAELIRLRIYRGQDTVGLTPLLANSYLPYMLRWLKYLGPVLPAIVLIIRLFSSIFSIGRQDMPPVSGIKYIAVCFVILGISSIDFMGMLLGWITRIIPFMHLGDNRYLSYHKDLAKS